MEKIKNKRIERKLMYDQAMNGTIKVWDNYIKDPDFIQKNNGSGYLLTLAQVNSAPNVYYTSDFRKLTAISTVQPQKKYNWLTSELHTYKDVDGKVLQGVLYKPENFDSKLKYPVIINYYQTNHLN